MRKRFLFGLLTIFLIVAAVRCFTVPNPIRNSPTLNLPAVKVLPAVKAVPPGWERHEYSGGEYYIIPLA